MKLFIFLLLLVPLQLTAQFRLLGDAVEFQADCIQLTPDTPFSRGIAYHEQPLDLSNYFQIEFDLYLGDKDDGGADGIVFVIHNDPRGYGAYGTWGECMSYGRWSPNSPADYIGPSVAVEFDTYFNPRQNDPEADHVAYLENGINAHINYWQPDGNSNYNLEDDRLHNFQMMWEPELMRLTIYLDGQVVQQQQKDLVNEIFGGQTQVIWGFTASTGRKFNQQYFCLRKWAKNEKADSFNKSAY